MISALILEEIMWKSRLKCWRLCKNKIVTIFLLVFYTSKRYLLKKHALYIYNATTRVKTFIHMFAIADQFPGLHFAQPQSFGFSSVGSRKTIGLYSGYSR